MEERPNGIAWDDVVYEMDDGDDPDRLRNFYGRSQEPRVRYVRERKRLDYGMAPDEDYSLEMIEAANE